MRAWQAGVALACLVDASARGSAILHAPHGRPPAAPRVTSPPLSPSPPAPPVPLPVLTPSRVRTHDATLHPGAPLRVRHEASPHPARAVLRVGRQTWIATPRGVLRFDDRLWSDPAHARPVGTVGGLPSPDVRALAPAPDGVWIGTARGLVVAGRGAVVRLEGRSVTALAPPFVGTRDGLFRLDATAAAPVAGTVGLHVTALLRCGEGLLVGTHDRGLWRGTTGGALTPVRGLTTSRVNALAGCDEPLAATLRGLFRVRDGVARPVDGAHAHAPAVTVGDGRIYVGTFGDGAARIDGPHLAPVTSDGRVSALAYDRAHDAVLVATDDALRVVRGGRAETVALPGGPRGRVVALLAEGRTLWAGTLNHGLYRRTHGTWGAVEGFDPRVSALAAAPDRRLWVGTAGGLGRLRADGSRVEPLRDPRGWFSRHINALQADGNALLVFVHPGVVGVAFRDGEPSGYRYLGSTDATELVAGDAPFTKELGALRRETVFALARDGSSTWLASAGGLLRNEGGELRALTELGGALGDRAIYDVVEARDGTWALGWRAGLLRWSGGAVDVWPARWLAVPRGLTAYRGGWLVPTEDRGLVRVERGAGALRFTAWGAAQGLSGDAADAVAVTAEGVWVGGQDGVDRLEDGGRALATRGGRGR